MKPRIETVDEYCDRMIAMSKDPSSIEFWELTRIRAHVADTFSGNKAIKKKGNYSKDEIDSIVESIYQSKL